MNAKKMETLKDKLIVSRELADVMRYFLDHFGEDPKFIALGERIEHPLLLLMLGQVARGVFGHEVEVTDVLLTHLEEHHFIHGTARLGGKLATVLYCEDLCKGLVTVCWSARPPETKYARFTGRPTPEGWREALN